MFDFVELFEQPASTTGHNTHEKRRRDVRRLIRLLSETEPFDDALISRLVILAEVIEQPPPTGNKHQQPTSAGVILAVLFQMSCQVLDAMAQHRNLHFW